MKILLLQDIPKLGRKGVIVDVSGGYAKNALFHKQLAVFADERVIKEWKARKEKEAKNREEKKEVLQSLVTKLQEHVFQFQIPVGKGGEIFSSLHEETIREHVMNFCKLQNQIIDSEDIEIKTKPIKEMGKRKLPIRLGRGADSLDTEITIELIPEASLNR